MDFTTPVLHQYGSELIADVWLPFKVVNVSDDMLTIQVVDVDPDGDINIASSLHTYKCIDNKWHMCNIIPDENGKYIEMTSPADLIFTGEYIEFRELPPSTYVGE